jgi:hypothetical protein
MLISLSLGGQTALAGIIVGGADRIGRPSDEAILAALTEWQEQQLLGAQAARGDQQLSNGNDGYAIQGLGLGSIQIFGVEACLPIGCAVLPALRPSGFIRICNAILPLEPVLAGLLKPS